MGNTSLLLALLDYTLDIQIQWRNQDFSTGEPKLGNESRWEIVESSCIKLQFLAH